MKAPKAAAAALVFGALFLSPMTTTRTARAAGEGSFGSIVLGCFHPEATFTSATYAHGRNGHAWTGWIRFREGRRDGFAMSFQMDMKKTREGETLYRVEPLMDDATMPPAAGCYLRDWQRY